LPGPNSVMPLMKLVAPTRRETSGVVNAPPPRLLRGISLGLRMAAELVVELLMTVSLFTVRSGDLEGQFSDIFNVCVQTIAALHGCDAGGSA
jgi:hypothetical protein